MRAATGLNVVILHSKSIMVLQWLDGVYSNACLPGLGLEVYQSSVTGVGARTGLEAFAYIHIQAALDDFYSVVDELILAPAQ